MPIIQVHSTRNISTEQAQLVVSDVAHAVAESLQIPLQRVSVTWSTLTAGLISGHIPEQQDMVVVNAFIKEGRSLALKQAMLKAIQIHLATALQLSPDLVKVFTVDLLDGSFT